METSARRLSLTVFCSFYRVLTVGAASVVKTAPPRGVWSDDGDNSAKAVVHEAAARVTKVMLWIRTQPSRKEEVTRNLSCKVHWEVIYGRIDPIHDSRHLCTHFRIYRIQSMSRGISGGKQVIKIADTSNRGQVSLFF